MSEDEQDIKLICKRFHCIYYDGKRCIRNGIVLNVFGECYYAEHKEKVD